MQVDDSSTLVTSIDRCIVGAYDDVCCQGPFPWRMVLRWGRQQLPEMVDSTQPALDSPTISTHKQRSWRLDVSVSEAWHHRGVAYCVTWGKVEASEYCPHWRHARD